MYRKRKPKVKLYATLGTIFTMAVGSVFHFLYEWSGKNSIIALFCAVNESIWEHLKLLVFPMLIFAIFEYLRIGSYYKNYLIAKALGILVGMLSIVMLFYTYTGIVGCHSLICDLIVFFISVIFANITTCTILNKKWLQAPLWQAAGFILIFIIVLAFFCFTYFAPHIALFKDSVTGSYGILL